MEIIFKIFFIFMKIGAFSFGGGLAMLPLIEKEIVYNNHWITSDEFVDIIAISQMTPGPIAINSATFIGYKIAKFKGALLGSIGVVTVSFILITVLAKYFIKMKENKIKKAVFKGIRPAVLGMILSGAISVGKTAFVDFKSIFIGGVIFFSLKKLKLNPIVAIMMAGVMGYLLY